MLPLRRPLCVLVLALLLTPPAARAADREKPLTRIAFGSCSDQDKPQPIWAAVVAAKPQLYLALGDNIYADTVDMQVMRAKYAKQAAVPGYQKLLKTCPVLATWDDHDMGKNDAGTEYPKKDEAQQAFLDFFGVPADSPRRKQKGVYHAEIFGPPGKRVQVILLDTRYFRSPLKRGKRAEGMTYTPYVANNDPNATILGAEQWKWFEGQLRKPAELRLLVSSIQVDAEDHGFEKWMNFPAERDRLFKLIRDTKASGVVVLSGDRHLAELSMISDAVGYPLYDLTSSGLNQASKVWRPLERNRHRVATMGSGDNFGLVTIDWSVADPLVSLQVRDVDGEIRIQERFPLSLLKASNVVAKPDPALPKGVLSTAEAAAQVGEKVTVQFKVQSVGGRTNIYLNSAKDFRSKDNFAVVIPSKLARGKFKGVSFEGKTVRVTGKVSKANDSPRIEVEEAGQIEVVGE